MSDRTRTTLRFLAGSYLAYTGFNLVKNILAERPDNFIVFMIVGFMGVALYGNFMIRIIVALFVLVLMILNRNKFIAALKSIKER